MIDWRVYPAINVINVRHAYLLSYACLVELTQDLGIPSPMQYELSHWFLIIKNQWFREEPKLLIIKVCPTLEEIEHFYK